MVPVKASGKKINSAKTWKENILLGPKSIFAKFFVKRELGLKS